MKKILKNNIKTIKDLSIVIASNLKGVNNFHVNQINNYAAHGIQIILSIPPNFEIVDAYNIGFSKNVSIIKSKFIGQVNQRQYAFQFCKTDFVIQMDDDIEFGIEKVNYLLSEFKKLPLKSCLAPYLNLEINSYSRNINLLKNIFLYCSLNPKSGSISRSSFPIPHNINFTSNLYSEEEVSWLPGGILILRKEDIITKNYFPFKGKAYCEDLIHSFYLKENGVKLYLSKKVFFNTEVQSYRDLDLIGFLNLIRHDLLIRNYYRKLIKNKLLPLLIAYSFIVLSFLCTKIKRNFLKFKNKKFFFIVFK